MSTPFVRYWHFTVRETFFRELKLIVNKLEELIEIFLSKLISEMALFTDIILSDTFIQTPNMPKKPLDLMMSKSSKYCVLSFTSISIKLIKIWHTRLFYKFIGQTKLRQFLLFKKSQFWCRVHKASRHLNNPDTLFCTIRKRFFWKLAD